MQGDELTVCGEPLGRQGVEPTKQGRELACLECGTGLSLDEADRTIDRAGSEGVGDRLLAEALRLQVRRSPLVEVASLVIGEPGAQVVGEQAVIAVPVPLGVEGDQEQVGALGLGHQRLGVLATGECPAQPSVEAVSDRGSDEERAHVVVDTAEDFVGEVIEHEALAATEGIDHRGGIGSVHQRDGCQLQARDPALGPLDKAFDEFRLERDTRLGQIR